MIKTSYGTEVMLLTKIDPITGWVTVVADLGLNGIAVCRIDSMDLVADGGYEEIEAASQSALEYDNIAVDIS